MEPESSLKCSQESATDPYIQAHIIYIYINPSKPSSAYLSHLLGSP